MTLDGTYDATVDRVVEGAAVVLVEGPDGPVAERRLDPADLPDEGDAEGDVLRVTFEAGAVVSVEAAPAERDRRRERARDRFDRLSERLLGDGANPDEETASDGETDADGATGDGT